MVMKHYTMLTLAMLLGIGYGSILEYTLDPIGGYVEWSLFGAGTVVVAAIPRSMPKKVLVGVLAGACMMLGIYLFAYYTGAMGRGADEFFLWGLLSAPMIGVQLGFVSGILAVVLHVLDRPIKHFLAH